MLPRSTPLLLLPVCLYLVLADPDIRIPPTITGYGVKHNGKYNETKLIIFKEKATLTMGCEASGDPTPTYKWKKNGIEVDPNEDNIQIDGGQLTISDLSIRLDEGIYHCEARNKHGTALSIKTLLRGAELNMESGPVETVPISTKEGDSFSLPCELKSSYPELTYTWYWVDENAPDDTGETKINPNKRITIDDKGSLWFTNAIDGDKRAGYIYKCEAINSVLGIKAKAHKSYKVDVILDSVEDRPPQLIVPEDFPPETIAVVGRPLALRCFFGGFPTPGADWQVNLPVNRYSKDLDNTRLTINNVIESDGGRFTCTGSSDAGRESKNYNVIVQAEPTFVAGPEDKTYVQGDEAVFECNTKAIPEVSKDNIIWMKNGEVIDPDNPGPRSQISADRKTLTIEKVCKVRCNEAADIFVVQCNASNVHGYAFRSGFLNVLLKTTLLQRPQSVEVDPNVPNPQKMIAFNCTAEYDPASTNAKMLWRFKDRVLYPNVDPRVILTTSPDQTSSYLLLNLTDIEEVEEADEYTGKYTCTASNGRTAQEGGFSQDSEEVSFTIKGRDVPVASAGFELWWIFIVIAVFLLLLILLLCCCMYLQRNKGEGYPVDEKEREAGNDPEQELKDTGFHDYQRPEGPAAMRASRASLSSDLGLDSEDDRSLAEYGGDDLGRFREDGSFIGQYIGDRKAPLANNSEV